LDAGTSQNNNNESSAGAVSASAEVVPATKVEMSFPLTGVVKTVEVRAGDQVAAGDTLVILDTVILEARVAEAEANLLAAETQVRYLRRVGTDEEHQESAKADVDRAQALLDSAKATLAQATLRAPIDGTIASVDISPAETVVPGQIVIVIGDLSHFQIETTDLSERDVPSVQVGQPVNVFIEALNTEFGGKVLDIARQATTVGGDTVFKVTIELDEQPQDLYWGMSADVEIQIVE
jgi:RND family efflux transporter MFP subunit